MVSEKRRNSGGMIYLDLEEDMEVEVKACFLEMIGRDKKNNMADDKSLEL